MPDQAHLHLLSSHHVVFVTCHFLHNHIFAATIEAALKQMVNYFLVNGFALSGSAERVVKPDNDSNGIQFKMVLNAPATLWGGRALQQQGSDLQNDFLLKAAKEYVTRAGYLVLSSSTKYPGTTQESFLSIR